MAIIRESRALDVGCGVGTMAITIAERFGAQVTAVDIGHARHCPGTLGHCDETARRAITGAEVPANGHESPLGRDTVTNCEPVRRCTRFVPGTRPLTLPGQKKSLQKGLKPTPGLEPGTPSLRVKCSTS